MIEAGEWSDFIGEESGLTRTWWSRAFAKYIGNISIRYMYSRNASFALLFITNDMSESLRVERTRAEITRTFYSPVRPRSLLLAISRSSSRRHVIAALNIVRASLLDFSRRVASRLTHLFRVLPGLFLLAPLFIKTVASRSDYITRLSFRESYVRPIPAFPRARSKRRTTRLCRRSVQNSTERLPRVYFLSFVVKSARRARPLLIALRYS